MVVWIIRYELKIFAVLQLLKQVEQGIYFNKAVVLFPAA